MVESNEENLELHAFAQLRGTEKQISWAEDIRKQKFNEMILHVNRYLQTLDEEYQTGAWLEFRDTIADKLGSISESTFWIDNRHKRAQTLFGEFPPTLPEGGKYHRGRKGGRGHKI